MGTKKGRLHGKSAPFKGAPQMFGGAVAQTTPSLDPPPLPMLIKLRNPR